MNQDTNLTAEYLEKIAEHYGLSLEDVVAALESSFKKGFEKTFDDIEVEVKYDFNKQDIFIYQVFQVVADGKDDFDNLLEIQLTDALKLDKKAKVGDTLKKLINKDQMDQSLRQKIVSIFIQRIKEIDSKNIANDFVDHVETVIEAKVEEVDKHKSSKDIKGYFVELGTSNKTGYLPKKEFIKHERLREGKKYLFVIKSVKNQTSNKQIILSRSHPLLLSFLLESVNKDIQDKKIEIKKVERVAGVKSKVAVISHDPAIDPIASILGPRGDNIKGISDEFNGEIIDIVVWNEDKLKFLINALLPANVIGYNILQDDDVDKSIEIIVEEAHLANVLGRKGTNINLLKRLTGWDSIDVYTESQAQEDHVDYTLLDFSPQGLYAAKMRREKIVKNNNDVQLQDKKDDAMFFTSKQSNDNEIEVDFVAFDAHNEKQKQLNKERQKEQLIAKQKQEKILAEKNKVVEKPKEKPIMVKHEEKVEKPVVSHPANDKPKPVSAGSEKVFFTSKTNDDNEILVDFDAPKPQPTKKPTPVVTSPTPVVNPVPVVSDNQPVKQQAVKPQPVSEVKVEKPAAKPVEVQHQEVKKPKAKPDNSFLFNENYQKQGSVFSISVDAETSKKQDKKQNKKDAHAKKEFDSFDSL